MKEQNYWQEFINTGKIEDYLSFKGMQRETGAAKSDASLGDNPYAGVCEVNRDGFEDGAYRGIR